MSEESLETIHYTIPSLSELNKTLKKLSCSLYTAWKNELAFRIHNLEFCGFIESENLKDIPQTVWRLPNNYIRNALQKLENDLDKLGYDYEFKFDSVNEINWVLRYEIDPPEGGDEDDDDDENSDEEDLIKDL